MVAMVLARCPAVSAADQDPAVLQVTAVQTAVLDPGTWDKAFPGERYFDALRALLVRFPGVAGMIHERLAAGQAVASIDLVLRWEKQEGPRPERGRHGWGANELYANRPGQWHVEARALRRPWSTDDPALAPTFNAWLQNAGFWRRGGGRDGDEDRYAALFGPLPLHAGQPEAVFDLMALLDDPAYGETLGHRLRNLEERGLQLHKPELYDMRYRSFWAYDWAVSTGYMRIWVEPPELRIRFRPATGPGPDPLPPPVDLAALAQRIRGTAEAGIPSLDMPADLADRVRDLLARPAAIPDWQWQRIQELRALHVDPAESVLALGRGFNFAALFAGDRDLYLKCMQYLMRMPPRTWQGHLSSDFALLAAGFDTLLPPAARDHLARYWKAWLHPRIERPFDADLGGGTHRGGPTYFRGYTRSMGTMNFVFNANMGALLGGQYLDAPHVLANARYGIEHLLLRAYAFGNGAHQEIGDTYYQGLTVAGAGAIARYAADPFDRLMGRIVRDRLVEPLISMYHPALRRMTHPMGRGSYTYHLLLQEGPYHVLHSLSPAGVLMHLDDLAPQRLRTPNTWGQVHGLSILGDEGPPERIGLLAPWIDPWLAAPLAELIDQKPIPWHVVARDSSPGCRPGGWHVNELSRHIALASRDNANHDYGVTSIVGQWRRRPVPVTRLDDLSTLLVSLGCNGRFPRENASMAEFGIVQRNRKLIALKALPDPDRNVFGREQGGVRSLHVSTAILAFGDTREREVWINDRRADAVSGARPDPGGDWRKRMDARGALVEARDGDVITIRDGAAYIAMIPISVNAMARDKQVEIAFEYPLLMINVHAYRDDEPLDMSRLYETDRPPATGFVLEMADADEVDSFEQFRDRVRAAALDLRWDAEQGLVHATYQSGDDRLEMGFDPRRYPAVYRRVNGQWPYLPEGVQRESTWAVQGALGHIEKQGVTLETEPGRQAYLWVTPNADTVVAYNPLPDPTLWRLRLPDGRRLEADGRLGLARVVVRPGENRVWVEHALKPDQTTPDIATAMLAFDWAPAPDVVLNGAAPGTTWPTIDIEGQTATMIPLRTTTADDVIARSERFRGRREDLLGTHWMDWQIAGPFPPDFTESHPPEQGVDLAAVYRGLDETEIRWQPLPADLDPPPPGTGRIDLEPVFRPGKLASAYAYTRIVSDADRSVNLFFGSENDAAIWVNGEPALFQHGLYRTFHPDQDRLTIRLREGENQVLLRLGRTWEGWRFSFRLADEFGLPLPKGAVAAATPR